MYRMHTQFIFILLAICILTFILLPMSGSSTEYKEGQCVKEGSPEAVSLQTRAITINKTISKQTDSLTSITSRVNEILLNYSNFKFSVGSVDVDPESTTAQVNIDRADGTTISNPNFLFTLVTSPTGEKGDPGNQGVTGTQGEKGTSGKNGFPGYWGEKGGCST